MGRKKVEKPVPGKIKEPAVQSPVEKGVASSSSDRGNAAAIVGGSLLGAAWHFFG